MQSFANHSVNLYNVVDTASVIQIMEQLPSLESIHVPLKARHCIGDKFIKAFVEWAHTKQYFCLNADQQTISYDCSAGVLVASKYQSQLLQCLLSSIPVVKSFECSESLSHSVIAQLIESHANTLISINVKATDLSCNIISACPHLKSLKCCKLEITSSSICFGSLLELKFDAFHYFYNCENDAGSEKVFYLLTYHPDDAVLHQLLLHREQFPVGGVEFSSRPGSSAVTHQTTCSTHRDSVIGTVYNAEKRVRHCSGCTKLADLPLRRWYDYCRFSGIAGTR